MSTDGDTTGPAGQAADSELDPAERLRGLLSGAMTSMLRTCLNHSETARVQWQTAAAKYRERWAQGDLDEVVPVLSDLMKWLRSAGIDPYRNPEVRALLDHPYVQKFGRVPTVDRDFIVMFRQLATAIRCPGTT